MNTTCDFQSCTRPATVKLVSDEPRITCNDHGLFLARAYRANGIDFTVVAAS